ncbi:DYNC1I2 isoform 14 [Pan troglodytes]|uniref:Dynein cytoplasmic 1 intermediate chain 2 n=2 Tax=Homininae TaxID=207598 RepID=E7EU01_HUMAN|nr:dynein cytoplasmic 1 intermediate chain 2 [Homo sapiens]KAI4036918.1 dynein cytoplasmic 1 intermediate chain 2 [Homo sapiens]PNI86396.1 DYNC1I2 isoform 14 [Pan troglodytes]
MSDKSELKAELERKKQRLAQIREEKKRKEEERKKKETDQKKEAVAPVQEESDLEKKRREAEALLQSMGLTPESPIDEDLLNLEWLKSRKSTFLLEKLSRIQRKLRLQLWLNPKKMKRKMMM